MAGDKGTVCVTGGTGYIGSWLIMRLLDQGYHVRTTIRSDPGKPHLCQGYIYKKKKNSRMLVLIIKEYSYIRAK